MKVVIVGGVAGGATAAARLRRLDEAAEIVILERSGYVSYANCGLPYYIGGVIREKAALTLQSPESFRERFRIDVRVANEVIAIDRAAKEVRVRRLTDGSEYTERYDKLLLSPGAKAIRPQLSGMEDDRIMTLRTVEDTLLIRERIERQKPRRAVVVGGGFIGLEVAENLMHAGIEVTLLQLDRQVLPPLDYDMACQIHAYLREKGMNLRLGIAAEGYEPTPEGIRVKLPGEAPLEADLVLMAIGVLPETTLAQAAGLTCGVKGAIVVDDRMRTSDPDIYAVGDAVEIQHFVSGSRAIIALAGPANKEARIAADNICGIESRFVGAQGTSVIKLFEMTAASTGLNERAAEAAGIRYERVVTYSTSHAAYYPGATDMTIKTLYEPESGRILGAQIVGFEGVDKRIDVLATAIRVGMTTAGLAELELAYAPPYSSAKDPVNMAGFVIENLRAGLVEQFHWQEVAALEKNPAVTLLDVRTAEEFSRGHFAGAVNIPVDELRERLEELDAAKPVYVNCFSGLRSYLACRILGAKGYRCHNFSGGYHFYRYIREDQAFDCTPTHPCGVKI